MKNVLLAILLLFTCLGFSQEQQEIHQRARINYSSVEDFNQLKDLGIALDHGTHKRGFFIISDFSLSEIEAARNAGFQVEILIENSKEHFLQENIKNSPVQRNSSCDSPYNYETPVNFGTGSMGGYFTYQEILDQLDLMRAQFPNLISAKENIGNFLTEGTPDNSVSPSIGGNGIKWIKISDNPNSSSEGEPQILYTSIHHAREPVSVSQLIFYMWYLLENYDSDPEIQSIVDNTELYFVPIVNPDGYLYNEKTDPNGGGFWRKNRKNTHGVDNNRNYNYFIGGDPNNGVWGGPGSSGNTNSGTYHGPAPFSEIENQAMKWFVENHNFVIAFNNHTSGELLYYPHAYANVATPEEDLFQGISSELVSVNGFQNLRDYPFSGESDDFMYGTVGTHTKIYSFTPEIGPSFWPPSNQIEGLCKTMMYLNITAAKMVNNYATISETSPQFVGNHANNVANFDIKRLGVQGSGNFHVSLNPISSNIVFVGGGSQFTGMDVLELDEGSVNYTIGGNVTAGDDIIYELVVNNGTFESTIVVSKKFGNLIPVFEDPGNSVVTNFINNGWGTTNATFVSPSSSITDSPGGNYANNANKNIRLIDPIDLSTASGANVNFYTKWDIENNWDYVQFQISIDEGSNWIPQCGKFTNAGSSNNSQPTGEPLYDGIQNEWVLEEIDLSEYLGESVLARFEFRSDGGQTADGFYFDDLTINIVENGGLAIDEFSNSMFSIYPNPVENFLNVDTELESYQIEVYNLQGQLILDRGKNSKSQTVNYSQLAAGIYLMKLTSETVTETFKVVKH